MPSVGKFMLTVFWDSQGVLFVHFKKRGGNVNSALYCEVLLKLWDVIRRKRPTNCQEGWCFNMALDPIQAEQPRGEFKNYSRNFLNIRITPHT
jgi:hypothetical protein